MSFPRSAPRGLASVLLLLLTLAAAGCASGPDQRPAAKHGGPPSAPLPTLTGKQTFFEGQVVAEVKIGTMAGFKRAAAKSGESAPEPRRSRRGGGGMGGGGRPPGGEREPGESGGAPRPAALRRGGPSGPPVMIHVRFTNSGAEAIELRVADFLSPLGNFVAHPEKLTLAPGASAELEPMSSGLAGQLASGEVTLKLQLAGKTETKTVTLVAEPPTGPESGNSGQSL